MGLGRASASRMRHSLLRISVWHSRCPHARYRLRPGVKPTTSAERGSRSSAVYRRRPTRTQRMLGQDGEFACSGTLIAPNLVLTARHCVSNLSETGECGIVTSDYPAASFRIAVGVKGSAALAVGRGGPPLRSGVEGSLRRRHRPRPARRARFKGEGRAASLHAARRRREDYSGRLWRRRAGERSGRSLPAART